MPTTLLIAALTASAGLPAVPEVLQPGAGEQLALDLRARGDQIYECRVSGTPARAAWVFVAPDAELFDASDRRVGRHGAGPYRQADDGSRVVGRVSARADAPLAGAIPWLLLAAQPDSPPGAFAKVTSIQRLHTVGGAMPKAACTPEVAGTTARTPYRADYRFFVPAS